MQVRKTGMQTGDPAPAWLVGWVLGSTGRRQNERSAVTDGPTTGDRAARDAGIRRGGSERIALG